MFVAGVFPSSDYIIAYFSRFVSDDYKIVSNDKICAALDFEQLQMI